MNNKTAMQVHAQSVDRLFNDKANTAKVQRASYQDSNIFGYKDTGDITVQFSAKRDQSSSRVRNNGTFNSRVFDNLDGAYQQRDEAVHSPSTTRQENKWRSTVFEGAII